jgi:ABC-2 type transport system permease protein
MNARSPRAFRVVGRVLDNRPVRLYWEFARRGYQRYAAYPAATWAGVFTNTAFGFMQAYILLALYRHRDVVGGYDASATVTYVWLAQGMLATVQMLGSAELALRIRNGDIATDLSRPVHPFAAGLAFDYGRALYHLIYRGLPPFVVGALVFDVTLPSSAVVWLALVVSLVLANCVSFAFRYLYNCAAFWMLDYRGVQRLSVALSAFFSGLYIPVAFFPGAVRTLANATPFPAMLQRTVDIFVGKAEGGEILASLGVQLGWAAALTAIVYALFAAGTRRLVVQGG